tara:strand:+ start:399 stop:548 length:150 start_codon:yes stop_codon:yes gene_type:complete
MSPVCYAARGNVINTIAPALPADYQTLERKAPAALSLLNICLKEDFGKI